MLTGPVEIEGHVISHGQFEHIQSEPVCGIEMVELIVTPAWGEKVAMGTVEHGR